MTREDVVAFVATLAIPEERRHVVLAELLDHLETAAGDGVEPRLGDLDALRVQLERIEPAFRFGATDALARGLVAATAVAGIALLIGLLPWPVVIGDSVASVLARHALWFVPGALASPILLLATPLAVRAQLRRFAMRRGASVERRRALRACAPAMLYISLVTWIPMYSALFVGAVTESARVDPVVRAFGMPVLFVAIALLAGAVRARRAADRGLAA